MNRDSHGEIALVVTHEGDRPLCRVRGEIDMTTASAISKVLMSFIEIGESDIALDLSEVDLIDTEGISELVRAHNAGLRMTIVAASPVVRRVLDGTQIEGFLAEKGTS